MTLSADEGVEDATNNPAAAAKGGLFDQFSAFNSGRDHPQEQTKGEP